jgi:hypothetical protein
MDEETLGKLRAITGEKGDMSKIVRALILREWDTQFNSIRVPIVGKIGIASGKSIKEVNDDTSR